MTFPQYGPALAARGFRVVPVLPRTKRPRFANWLNVATSDPVTVGRWAARYEHCGTGLVPHEQLVVDIDDPEAWREHLAARGVTLPPTWTVATGRGHHLWFSLPGELSLPNGRLPGVDVKLRGLLVGPGSIHPSGAVYRVVEDLPLAPAPEWLIEALAEAAAARPVQHSTGAVGGGVARRSDPRRVVGRVHAAREGERNDIVFWAFCRAAEERDEAYMNQVREAAEEIGLEPDELTTVERSARRKTGWTA